MSYPRPTSPIPKPQRSSWQSDIRKETDRLRRLRLYWLERRDLRVQRIDAELAALKTDADWAEFVDSDEPP